jgi:UDP-N-acetylmuramoyl-tripeptide--D-alanyl-D-alanine ligase
MTLVLWLVVVAATVVGSPRWLRVAQREHYLASGTTRFALRWWTAGRENRVIAAAGVVAALVAFAAPPAAMLTAVVLVAGPAGLGLRGRTSKLVWTRRMRTTAAVAAVLHLAAFGLALLTPVAAAVVALVGLASPLLIDAALALTGPFERRVAQRFVAQATATLRREAPTIVAITGSYGKTTTKVYVRHLLAGHRSVLASPASFNNTNGLARTVNEHWTPGTEVFVAEMGMYGPGEIRSLCSWVRPRIGVITAIGPVHLERVGSIDGIVAAKSEIVEDVEVGVLNVDAYGLAAVADRLAASGRRVVRCSTADTAADVCVRPDGTVTAGGRDLGRVELGGAQASNVACALGVAVALGIDPAEVLERVATLPASAHRQEVAVAPSGLTVIDNTFSSNPASAASSLDLLVRLARPGHRRVVVTPGMVELGAVQADENERFARAAAAVASEIVIVGRTNRVALDRGVAGGGASVHHAATRDEAVAWVRGHLGEGDVVLYEGDLPDHYP